MAACADDTRPASTQSSDDQAVRCRSSGGSRVARMPAAKRCAMKKLHPGGDGSVDDRSQRRRSHQARRGRTARRRGAHDSGGARARSHEDVWTRARCVVVLPDLKKAAFIVGGEYGKGVMSCRAGDQWSAPVFMQLAKGQLGLPGRRRAGGPRAARDEREGRPEAAAEQGEPRRRCVGRRRAARPAGRRRHRCGAHGRDPRRTRARRGSFAGIDISGGVLRPDEEVNVGVYGAGSTRAHDSGEPRNLGAA